MHHFDSALSRTSWRELRSDSCGRDGGFTGCSQPKGMKDLASNENPTQNAYDPQRGLNQGVQFIHALYLNINVFERVGFRAIWVIRNFVVHNAS